MNSRAWSSRICGSSSSVSSSTPEIEVSGVRNSCETFATKSLPRLLRALYLGNIVQHRHRAPARRGCSAYLENSSRSHGGRPAPHHLAVPQGFVPQASTSGSRIVSTSARPSLTACGAIR